MAIENPAFLDGCFFPEKNFPTLKYTGWLIWPSGEHTGMIVNVRGHYPKMKNHQTVTGMLGVCIPKWSDWIQVDGEREFLWFTQIVGKNYPIERGSDNYLSTGIISDIVVGNRLCKNDTNFGQIKVN